MNLNLENNAKVSSRIRLDRHIAPSLRLPVDDNNRALLRWLRALELEASLDAEAARNAIKREPPGVARAAGLPTPSDVGNADEALEALN